jgi:hypothetical protein
MRDPHGYAVSLALVALLTPRRAGPVPDRIASGVVISSCT